MLEAATRDRIFGPGAGDYPAWQKKIKHILDPDAAAGRFYSAE